MGLEIDFDFIEWILNNIWIFLAFWYKQIKRFFNNVNNSLSSLNNTLTAHTVQLQQHGIRIQNLESQ